MAVWYSDWYGTQSSAGASTIAVPAIKTPWGVNTRTYKRCQIVMPLSPVAFTAADTARLMHFKTSDRLVEILVTAAGATAAAADIGFYLSGANHDGGTCPGTTPTTLFASALVLTTIARVDEFLESAVNINSDRGQAIWELLALTADPNVEVDLSLTCTTTLTTALGTVTVECRGSFS